MLHVVKLDRSYDPETIAIMTTAFDAVCQSLSVRIRDDEHLQRTIALAILRLADQGVRDPMLLADAAFRVLAARRVDRSLAVSSEAKKYWQYSRECTKRAIQAETPKVRDQLLELARVWTEAALSEQMNAKELRPEATE